MLPGRDPAQLRSNDLYRAPQTARGRAEEEGATTTPNLCRVLQEICGRDDARSRL